MIRRIIFMILFPVLLYADINDKVYADMNDLGNGKTEFVITDLCGQEHRKIFTKREIRDLKPLEWFRNLESRPIFNSCIDSF